jgi:4-hydroxy-3-methylbut-2-enyl diphosphate reductase
VKPSEPVGRVVQTTLDAAAQDGVCTATRDRQQAVRDFVAAHRGASVGVLVVGGAKSANTARLAEIAENGGAKAWRVSSAEEVSRLEFGALDILGVTSGASTPESLFQAVLRSL